MFHKILRSAAIGFAALCGGLLAIAAPIPNVPSSPNFSDASQIVGTLNALVNQLNGNTGYAPAQTVSLGSFCQNAAAGATPQVCNGQRGAVAFTGLTVAATGTNQAIVITDSSITTASVCSGQFITAFTAGSAVVTATLTPTAGSLSVIIANAGATTNAVTTGTFGFSCN